MKKSIAYMTTALAFAGAPVSATAAAAKEPIQFSGVHTYKSDEDHSVPVGGDPRLQTHNQ